MLLKEILAPYIFEADRNRDNIAKLGSIDIVLSVYRCTNVDRNQYNLLEL